MMMLGVVIPQKISIYIYIYIKEKKKKKLILEKNGRVINPHQKIQKKQQQKNSKGKQKQQYIMDSSPVGW
jgi:hypothetical protein